MLGDFKGRNGMTRDELQEALIQTMLDSMDMDDLMQIAYDCLSEHYKTYTEQQLISTALEFYPEVFNNKE